MSTTMKEDARGNKRWYIEEDEEAGIPGGLHRDGDLPAIEYADGSRKWYQHGALHRDGDKPAVEMADGTRKWYVDGKAHREGGPAVILPGGRELWYNNGRRIDPQE